MGGPDWAGPPIFPGSAQTQAAERDDELTDIIKTEIDKTEREAGLFPKGVEDQHDVTYQKQQRPGGKEDIEAEA